MICRKRIKVVNQEDEAEESSENVSYFLESIGLIEESETLLSKLRNLEYHEDSEVQKLIVPANLEEIRISQFSKLSVVDLSKA
jgi:hypothetical protein